MGFVSCNSNQEDSKIIKIRRGEDILRISYYGINKTKYKIAILEGKPLPALELIGNVDMSTTNNACNTVLTPCCGCIYFKEHPIPDPPIQDTLFERMSRDFLNVRAKSIEIRR